MTVVQFQVPRLDVADRILGRLDLTSVSEAHFIGLVQSAGFKHASISGRLSAREQIAFLVNSIGEAETLQRLLELSSEDVVAEGEDPANVEFQVTLAQALREQGDRLGIPADDVLPQAVLDVGYGDICSSCGRLDVRLHPWPTITGELLLQWRRGGRDYVATIYVSPAEGELRMCLETAERQDDLAFTSAGLLAFVRYGVL